MNTNKLNEAIDRIADRAFALSSKLRRHPIATSMVSLALVAITAVTVASYCAPAPPAPPAPTGTSGSRTFNYDITVPLFYNGQNVGSTVIPKGSPVEVISETETTITIRHTDKVLTINKPGKNPVATVTAKPVIPKGTRDTSQDAERIRIGSIKPRALPFPIMRVEIEADGSYTYASGTCDSPYPYERVGTKIRVYIDYEDNIWEADEADTLESKIKTDPKLVDLIKAGCGPMGNGYTYEEYITKFATKRISFAPNPCAISRKTPIKEVIELIAKRDPRMQALIDACNEENAWTISWRDVPTQCERVDINTIAMELRNSKLVTPTAVSLRGEVERLKVPRRLQIGNTCSIYSAYHLIDYHIKKGILRPVTFAQLYAYAGPRHGSNQGIGPNSLLSLLVDTQPGIKIRVREMKCIEGQTSIHKECSQELLRTFIQNEIACGRPLWVGVDSHQVMMVGYQPSSPGKAEKFIAFDSTGFGNKDHGYSRWNIEGISKIVSFEFIK